MARGFCEAQIIIVLITLNFTCVTLKCISGITTLGYTRPAGDVTVEYGDPLQITCVIDNKTYVDSQKNISRNLRFYRDKEMVTENVEILNETSIRLNDPHVPKNSSWYYCVLINDKGEREAVCHNRVIVGTKPMPVLDFSCISNNLDNLTCSWSPPDNNVMTTYDLWFTLPGRAGRLNPSQCPVIREEKSERGVVQKMYCFWSVSTTPHYRQAQPMYNFNLTMNNTFGFNHKYYVFEHFKYVRSGPPENLTAVNATTNSILLYWKIPSTMLSFLPGLKFRILYQCVHGPKDWEVEVADIVYPSKRKSDEYYYNLTGLKHAHDLCDIRVSLRSNKSVDENMWSTNSSITYRTASTLPGAPPEVNIGSFQIDKRYNFSKHDVYIYWRQIPEEIKNGEDFKYNVEVIGNHDNVKLAEKTMSYAKFENLLSANEYTFTVWSENSEGASIDKSFVTVPPLKKRPSEIETFTKMARLNGTYELYIKPPKSNYNVKNFTIFWCKNLKDRPFQCTGYLNWTEVPRNMTNFKVPVIESNDAIWQFAMSVNSERYSSGMVWASCTLLDDQRIGKIKQVFKIGNGRSDSIQLGWKLDCVDMIPNIEGFVIYYCQIVSPKTQNCKEPIRNVTVLGDASTTNGNVTGLKPYTTYRLNVSIKTKNGDIGEMSDTVYETTLEGAPSTPLNVTIPIIGVTNSSVKLVWQPPDEMNGALKYYEVHFNNRTVKVNPDPNPELTWKDLESFQEYNISVMACTTSCSHPSPYTVITTKIGIPEQIKQPRISFQNNSYILVDWQKPHPARGRNDYYEVQIREKRPRDTKPPVRMNVTDQHSMIDCGEGGELNTLYLSVRAINIAGNEFLYGPWSDELECYCSNPPKLFIWVLVIIGFVAMVLIGFAVKRTFMYCKVMKNVELKLPPGLAPLPDWGSPKGQDEQEHTPSADEELLLEKMNENRIPSGDSSGCCSGHGSVASDSGTTMSSTSDSGTEQNELRKRAKNSSSTPMRLGINTQYVTMPTDAMNKPRIKPLAGNYCVLGVDPSAPMEPESAYISSAPQVTAKLPYIPCDVITPPSPYVLTGDLNKPTVSGYVPLNYPEVGENNPSYVMAGAKNVLMPETSKKQVEKPLYVQVSDATKNMSDVNPWQHQVDNVVPKGYVSVGEALPVNKRVNDSKKGYVPHSRHFDTKLLKED